MKKEPKQIRSEVVINAKPEVVWDILTDFKKYPHWNPFIKSIEGAAIEGTRIKARIEPPGASGMTFKPKLLSVKKNSELRWLGNFVIPGLFDGEHIFELYENTGGSTTFVQREVFTGVLVPLFKKMLDVNTVQGFDLMNKKIKAIAEGQAPYETRKRGGSFRAMLMMMIIFASITSIAVGQDLLGGRELSLNLFRNPSVGLEYRVNRLSIHAGYYPTNFESGVTTSFIRTGLTYWFLPVGKKENPSSFYSLLSYVRGVDREYESKNAGIVEGGFRWMAWKGLNLRLGVATLLSPGKDVQINPTPGISYAFFL